jgi:hypothetical protein
MKSRCESLRIFSLLLFSLIAASSWLIASDPDPAIASTISQVQQTTLYNYVGRLSGEFPVRIGGESTTIRSRNTVLSGGGIQKATQFAYEHMQSLGLAVRYQDWTGCPGYATLSSRNVIGEKTGYAVPEEIVIVMAHVDSMPASSLNYGADDNASGSAAVLTAADILSHQSFQRTIRFLLTTGEEQGLCGSRAYAAMANAQADNIVAVFNMDMIAWNSDNVPSLRLHTRSLDRPGYDQDRAIAETFVDVVGTYRINLIPIVAADYSTQSSRNSDQCIFWDYNYPAILAIEDNANDFNRINNHTLNDRLSSLNLSYFTNYTKAAIGTISNLARIARSEMDLTLSGGGSWIARTTASFGPAQAGYATAAVHSGSNPYGAAAFSFRQNGIIVSEAAVPSTPPTTAARIFIDYRNNIDAVPGRSEAGTVDINTGIAVVNSRSATAVVTYVLRDLNGNTLTTGHGTVAAGLHFACFIDQLKNVAAADFNLPANFPDAIQLGTLEITSDQPLSILALRGTFNQRDNFLITTTPVADLTQSLSSTPLYFPQFVDGGGYTTSLILMNTSGSPETGRFQIMDAGGSPLAVTQAGGTNDSSFRYLIPAGGVYRFQTDGFPASTVAGWVRLIPDAGSSTPVGTGIFGYTCAGVLISESGIPAAAETTHARILVDLSGKHNTGLAIANVVDENAAISITAYQLDGSTTAGERKEPLSLPANGYAAAFADSFIQDLPEDFKGVIDISSTTPFAALTLRSLVNEHGDFLMTAFPIADAYGAAPAPIVFPHIVAGGGYETQFILLSATGGADGTIAFYDEQGRPWGAGEND